MARTFIKTIGGGGANVFSGNTNLSGDYYGDVIVYGGDATVTGNLVVHGNLIVEGAMLCTGNFSIDVKNDCLIQDYFDYQPATGGQDISIGGDFYVKGKTSVANITYGPFTITTINDASLYVPVPPNIYTALEIAEDISLLPPGDLEVLSSEPSYPYTVPIVYTNPSPPLSPPNFIVVADYPTPLSIGEQWQATQSTTVHQDIVIKADFSISLIVGGNFYLRKLEGHALTSSWKSLSIVVGGDVIGLRDTIDYNSYYLGNIIDVRGSDAGLGGGSGGDVTVRGTVYECAINTYGSDTISASDGGDGGAIYLNSFIASYNRGSAYIDTHGGNKNTTSSGRGGNGGRIQIDGLLICRNIYTNGGGHTNGSAAAADGGTSGEVVIYGNASFTYCYTMGGYTNAVTGYGRAGGNVTVYGNLSGFGGSGQILAGGGTGYGSGRAGGSGGTILIYGDITAFNSLFADGGSGVNGAVGGNGGFISLRRSVSVGDIGSGTIRSAGGSTSGGVSPANGGSGGTVSLRGPSIYCGFVQSYGGNSTNGGNGGNGGQVQLYGYAVARNIESYGGNGINAGSGSSIFLSYGGVFETVRMTDGTGVASTASAQLNLGGHIIARTINVTNRSQLTIRGISGYSTTLVVGSFTAKDILSNPSGANNSAAQAALCKDRTYVHDPVDARWKYASLTIA